MQTWTDVAVLAKTRNLNGRFVVRAAAGLPFLLNVGDEVAFVPPQLDVPRRATVSEVRYIDDVSAEVTFKEVTGEAAEILVGSHCLIPQATLRDEAIESAPAVWEGWAVVDDTHGEIGTVAGVIDNPAQSLIEVGRPDGGTVLIPVVDEIVHEVDIEAGVVYVSLPKGLLDL